MPVKSDDKAMLVDLYLPISPVSEHFLPDDVWKKFGVEWCPFDAVVAEEPTAPPPPFRPEPCEIRNHDCMWAGHCGCEGHPGAFAPQPQSLLKPAWRAALPHTPPLSDDEDAQASGVLKLLHAAIEDCDLDEDSDLCDYFEDRGDLVDDEDVKEEEEEEEEEEDDDEEEEEEQYSIKQEKYNIKQEEYNIKEEEYNIKEEEPVQEEEEDEEIRSYQLAAESDHSYHKGKIEPMNVLGIDTPSDSEEEIDVVSIVDRTQLFRSYSSNSNNSNNSSFSCSSISSNASTSSPPNVGRAFAAPAKTKTAPPSNKVFLPTNPSNRDKHKLQHRLDTAITKKKAANGSIKTILPVKKAAAAKTPSASAPAKRKNGGGNKRGTPPKATGKPYRSRKRHDSESEPEPSEKRSLHNNMERQRRIDLRNAFEDLRLLVPEVSKKERAAKVVILREAAQYCDFLTNTSTNYNKHAEDLKRRQEWLRQRVSMLRRNLAAKR